MYQVIVMYGGNEPWWFFEDWQADIIEETKFAEFSDAVTAYQMKHQELSQSYEKVREKEHFLSAFWNEGEIAFCEDCDDDLQQYKGLLILKDFYKINVMGNKINEATDTSREAKRCPRPSESSRSHAKN